VAAVHHLEESDLRVASQVNVLGAVSDKLHKASSGHGSFILREYKKILGKHIFLEFGRDDFFDLIFIFSK
jgi:hypothetical protein